MWIRDSGQRCVAWRKVAEIIGQHSKKGDKLYIEGKLQTRSYDKDGQTHYTTEVVVNDFTFLSNKGEGRQASEPVAVVNGQSGDELPF